jgi:hypothetical protein
MFLSRLRVVCVNIFERVFILKNIRKILIIFFIGFSFRFGINYFLDINVFLGYLNAVSLTYYGFMYYFSVFFFELPRIGFNVLNLNLVRSAIRVVCGGGFLSEDKMLSGDNMFTDNMYPNDSKDLSNDGLVCKQDRHGESSRGPGRRVRRPSAGIIGLYGDSSKPPVNSRDGSGVSESSRESRKVSSRSKVSSEVRTRTVSGVSSSPRVSPNSRSLNAMGTRGSLNSSRSGSIVIGLDNDTRYSLLIQ